MTQPSTAANTACAHLHSVHLLCIALPSPQALAFAKAMAAMAATIKDPAGNPVRMRIGIHTGSVTSGVIGRRCPRFLLMGGEQTLTQALKADTGPQVCAAH